MLPGQNHLTWVSPKVDEYCNECFKALADLDLILTRCNDLVTYRIEAVFEEMLKIKLCEFNDEEPMPIGEFLQSTEELCRVGANILQTKSQNIEEAVEELIDLLYPEYQDKNDVNDQVEAETRPLSVHARSAKSLQERPVLTASQISAKKKRDAKKAMQELAAELFAHFNHRNQETIIKLIRNTLEKLRKRIVTASQAAVDYGITKSKQEKPVFKCFIMLAIPSITLQPSLDEIQQSLNKASQLIIQVSKSVSQWKKNKNHSKLSQL